MAETGLEPLSFAGPLLLVGGGRVESGLLRTLAGKAAGVVGADGGADRLLAAGVVPHAVIGDMDSVRDRGGFPPETRIVALADQDTTDFEKCLSMTRSPLTLALGMTGGRLDHTLAALDAVARHAARRRIILIDECDLALGVSGSIALAVGAGSRVSVHPLGRTRFARSEGLLYPLTGLVLAQGERVGTSNLATASTISIAVEEGDPYLLILPRERLDTVLVL